MHKVTHEYHRLGSSFSSWIIVGYIRIQKRWKNQVRRTIERVVALERNAVIEVLVPPIGEEKILIPHLFRLSLHY